MAQGQLTSLQNGFILSQEKVIKDLHAHLKVVESEIELLREHSEQLAAKHTRLEDENCRLREQNEELREELSRLGRSLKEQQRYSSILEASSASSQCELDEYQRRLQEVESEAKRLASHLLKEREAHKRTQLRCQQDQADLKVADKIKEALATELSRSNQELRESRDTRDRLSGAFEKYRTKYRESKQANKELLRDIDIIRLEFSGIKSEQLASQEHWRREISSLEGKYRAIEAQLLCSERARELLAAQRERLGGMLEEYSVSYAEELQRRRRLEKELGEIRREIGSIAVASGRKRYYPSDEEP